MRDNKSRSKFAALLFLCGSVLGFGGRAMASDTILILPFENRSQMGEYNWIRESFPILISEVLDAPGFYVINTDERNLAFEKLKLSPNDLLTRAAMLKLADSSQANLVLIGEFDIGSEKENPTIAINARLIEAREGRLVGNKVFNFSGPLENLQEMLGQLAWNVLYIRNPSLPYTSDQLVRRATNVPPRAFESYIKGIQTPDLDLREGFLKRAIQEHEMEGAPGHYAQAIYALGMVSYRRSHMDAAIKQFSLLVKDDPNYEESLFYLGLASFKSGNQDAAIAAFEKLAAVRPLYEVYNNMGAAMLARGDADGALQNLRKAVANSPYDSIYRFNYGYALWRNRKFAEAADHLAVVVKTNPRDGEAQYLLAKSLSGAGRTTEATQADDEARRYLESYAKWEVAQDRIPMLVRLKPELNRSAFYRIERQQQQEEVGNLPSAQQISLRQSLDRARQLISENSPDKDTEAMTELGKVIAAEATNAEGHYLKGLILQRRSDSEGALRALQAAVMWNPRLIEAHVALGRFYLARGDRALALSHSRQALAIDPQHRDAIALKQQIETGR